MMLDINKVECEFIFNNVNEELIDVEDLKTIWNDISEVERSQYFTTKKCLLFDCTVLEIKSLFEDVCFHIDNLRDFEEGYVFSQVASKENLKVFNEAMKKIFKDEIYYEKDCQIDFNIDFRGEKNDK